MQKQPILERRQRLKHLSRRLLRHAVADALERPLAHVRNQGDGPVQPFPCRSARIFRRSRRAPDIRFGITRQRDCRVRRRHRPVPSPRRSAPASRLRSPADTAVPPGRPAGSQNHAAHRPTRRPRTSPRTQAPRESAGTPRRRCRTRAGGAARPAQRPCRCRCTAAASVLTTRGSMMVGSITNKRWKRRGSSFAASRRSVAPALWPTPKMSVRSSASTTAQISDAKSRK